MTQISIETSTFNLPWWARDSGLQTNLSINGGPSKLISIPVFGVSDVYITNTSSQRSITLNIVMIIEASQFGMTLNSTGKDGIGRVLGKHDTFSAWQQQKFGEAEKRFILSPVILKPLETVTGTVPFLFDFIYDEKIINQVVRYLADGTLKYKIKIVDPISQSSVTFSLPGKYPGPKIIIH